MTETPQRPEGEADEELDTQERVPGEQLYALRITAAAEVIRADGTKE
jgi:hypothetical protein